MSAIKVAPVVLCGGSGTRLWPLSRKSFPKQFLVLSGSQSLFQQAVSRLSCLGALDISLDEMLIVTNEEHRFLVLDQLREVPGVTAKLLLEPVAKNTAPALTLAALQAIVDTNDPVMVVTPADQTVTNDDAYTEALQNSIRLAAEGNIVILGITPNRPDKGFGYIKKSGNVGDYGDFRVEKFVEKPNLETANQYLISGEFAWNSGIFVVRASIWLSALKEFRPNIFHSTSKSFARRNLDQNFVRPDPEIFDGIPSESIDYAVIEHCSDSCFPVRMIPLDAGWNDLGSWDSVWQVGERNDNGNVVFGDAILSETKNTLIHSSHRLVATIGLNDLVIIETADAILVADRKLSQQVKMIVDKLEADGREEVASHRKVMRPWGWYDTIDEGDRFKVKRIQVNPGASLSLQKHAKRAEHWVVVKGTAEVTCGDQVITLKENESTFIPLGEQHRLSNPSTDILEIIEVQSGAYLGEDDIERFKDNYGR